MKYDLITELGNIFLLDQEFYRQKSGNDSNLAKFHEQYPIDSILDLELMDYCLGRGCRDENFCWWIERGLEKSLGRYMPGTSRGHLIYFKNGLDDIYLHRKLSDLDPEEALQIVLKITYAVASCDSLEEAAVIDDRNALAKRAGIDPDLLVGGDARFLRLLAVYHPEWMIPINSGDHIRHFLGHFSEELEPELPAKSVAAAIELEQLFKEVREQIDPSLSPWGFMELLYHKDLGIAPQKRQYHANSNEDDGRDEETAAPIPLNQILYGPPGTGKTYTTVEKALEIIDPVFLAETEGNKDVRAQRKKRYDELFDAKRIGFVTFHQSFSYEDFVEGLKASLDAESNQVQYQVEDGIFKRMAEDAAAAFRQALGGETTSVEVGDRQVWKMSLGNTLGPDASIYDECIEKGMILLGWGQDVDFSGVSDRDGVLERLRESVPETKNTDFAVTACNAFVNNMNVGDLVVVSDGNYKFRAIGEITGDYHFLPVEEGQDDFYQQSREVKWHRVFSPSVSHEQLINNIFSQATIYQLKPPALDKQRLQSLLQPQVEDSTGDAKPYVLIIDEINRGNIARIFGELITLIEDSKREGQPESLQVRLPYSKKEFTVPRNLYLVGTMNTADRSLAQIDIALRRRFVFEELMPDSTILNKIQSIDGIQVDKLLAVMNQRIEALYDREHTIGHTFFLSLKDDPSLAELERIFSGRILPLLEEYFFEDWEKIRLVLNDHRKPAELAMIRPKFSAAQMTTLFGAEPDHPINIAFERNLDALESPESYIAIYDPKVVGKENLTPES